MKRILVAATFVTSLCLVPGQSMARTELVSAPLPGGEGGHVCSCIGLTNSTIVVNFELKSESGAQTCPQESIGPGEPGSCENPFASPRTCRISRDDGKPASTKHLACTWSSLDVNGNPTAVAPVDKKLKR